jgi:hypothetical protein
MSQDIRHYETANDWLLKQSDVSLTATVGGDKYGHSIQFTTENDFFVLSEEQLRDLLDVIQKRLNLEDGYTATGIQSEEKVVKPDGGLVMT